MAGIRTQLDRAAVPAARERRCDQFGLPAEPATAPDVDAAGDFVAAAFPVSRSCQAAGFRGHRPTLTRGWNADQLPIEGQEPRGNVGAQVCGTNPVPRTLSQP